MQSSLAIEEVYGRSEGDLLSGQRARLDRDLVRFRDLYGSGPVRIYRAPGRINLIGEHTDYNQGYVMPMALDRDVLLLARPREDTIVRLANVEPQYPSRQFAATDVIPRLPLGDWGNYAQGAVQLLCAEHGVGLRGLDGLVDGEPPWGVPRGAGLSSSSALTVVTAVATVDVNGLDLSGAALADACGRAEWYVGTRGGIMDQFISILARRDHALFLDCRPAQDTAAYVYGHVPIPADLAIVVVDSGVRHLNTGPLFNRRVAEGRIGVRLLQRHSPLVRSLRDVSLAEWPSVEPLLPEFASGDDLRSVGIDPDTILGDGRSPETDQFCVRSRCRHVITENARVLETVGALRTGDVGRFGRLLNEAHASARDDYDISIPEIEALVAAAVASPGCYGARLTGAGWGGCIVAAVDADTVQAFVSHVSAEYRQRSGRAAAAFVCRSAPGAGLLAETCV